MRQNNAQIAERHRQSGGLPLESVGPKAKIEHTGTTGDHNHLPVHLRRTKVPQTERVPHPGSDKTWLC